MLEPMLVKNDAKARVIIIAVSIVVFLAVAVLSRVQVHADLPFDVHIFAKLNAIINSIVSVLLIAGLWAIRKRQFVTHKKIMLTAMVLSVIFLLSYIAHHLLAGETKFGDLDHNGVLSEAEKVMAGNVRMIYYIILLTHIPLAGIILPFILFTAYRSMIGEYDRHKKLARFTWPIWFYVAVTGVIVYLMIEPYYVA